MKCPKCGYEQAIYDDINEWWHCPQCHGSGEVQMTNEEFLRTCNTEQLAEWLAKQKCDGCNDEPYDDKHGTCKYCMTKKKEQIRQWLKQPHPNE